MKVCTKCGMLNADTATFCIECGSALENVSPEDEFFSQSEKTTVINREEDINGYVDGEEKTTIIDPLDNAAEETAAPKSMGLKLNLGNDPEPVKFRTVNDPTPNNQTGYANEGYNSFANNTAGSSMNNTAYGSMSNAGSSYNAGNSYGSAGGNSSSYGPSGNDMYTPSSTTYVSAPDNNAARNFIILGVLGIVVVLMGFLLLGGGAIGKMKVSNTPRQALEAFFDDFEDFSFDHIDDYSCREIFDRDLQMLAGQINEMQELLADNPTMTFTVEIVSYGNEVTLSSSDARRYKSAFKAIGLKKKVGDVCTVNISVRMNVKYAGQNMSEDARFKATLAQYDGKWRICGLDNVY